MHYDYQSSARTGDATTGKHVAFWTTDTRLPRTDPIWDYVLHANKAWGNVPQFDFEADFDYAERMLSMANGYMERDEFERIAIAVMTDTIGSFAWEVNKFGSSPGGEPYMEAAYKRYDRVNGEYRDQTFFIALGLTENYNADGSSKPGTRWYVDFKTEGGDVLEYVYMEWAEMTPRRLAGWVRHFVSNIPLYPFQADFRVEDASV